ncbi:site-specific integrase [Roseburia amylophila]|uniref:site-specific integrase n=1 Tax=Roseburia amylophila TaxID=2981794 RepID=UPI000822E4A6|nr:site-specific integrase [Roseburia amylophila]SCH31590.1 Tyrosine recombinase XerC [uncultured Roseburia sp.]
MPAYKDEKTGKWFAKFYYTNWQGIKKQKWKRGFATKKEALGFERDFLEKQSANPDMTFQNLYEIYMEDMAARLKQSTLLTKKAVLQTHILPFFGSKPINEIKASDVRRWQAKLMSSPNNYSQTYLKKINTELNSIINYAKRFYDLNTNPCGKAGTIGKAKAEEMHYWTYDEYIAFREGVKDKSLSYICFEVLYWTGMREGELLALSPADIDLDNKTISINRTYQRIEGKDVFTSPKTRKSKRKIPIPDFLCQELSDYIQSRYMLDADERLFPVTKSYLSHEMIRGCKNTGVKKIRIHDIRHSHASLLINQGCDALMLADRLGHEKVSTTLNTYSHLFPHKQQELVHSLESLQATDSPTPEPPSDNPLLEAAGITCEVSQTQDNGSDVTIRPQFGPALVPPNTASGKIIQMPQRKII